MDANTLAWGLLLFPLFSAGLILLVLRRFAGLSELLSTGSAIATFFFSLSLLGQPAGAAVIGFPWIDLGDVFRAEIGVTIDPLSQGMMIVVTAIGALVHVFSLAYMKDDAGKSRYFAGLSLFMFAMTGIVLANNFIMMFVFWELVGVSSYLLIGHWFDRDAPAEAAKKAFLTNRVGDFGFMIGILLVWVLTGSIYFADIEKAVGGVGNAALLNAAVLCVFCGAVGKSAQFPLHVWLPDAMEGPTPVSALIHAATMVAAGVYMLARVAFLVAAAGWAADVIAWTGAVTALLAALMATQQNDIKRVLAYSTLSQLGYMVMAQGVAAADAGMFHLYTHAFFKALLFLAAGALIFACHHEQDIWKMGGLRRKMPVTFATFLAGTAALIAVPLTSGFWSKEMILEAALEHGNHGVYAIGIAVAFLTPFYMTRLVVVAFFGKPRENGADHAREVGPLMTVPLLVLAVMSLLSAYPFLAEPLKSRGHAGHFHFGLTAILSLAGLASGAGLAVWLYRGKSQDPVRITLFARKFYLDELYIVIVRVFQDFLATVAKGIDKFLIDPVVSRGPALGAFGLGYMLRMFHMGNLQVYVFLFGLGAIALIWVLIS